MDLGWVGMTLVWSEKDWTSRWTSSRTTGDDIRKYFSFHMDSGRLRMSLEWSRARVVSAEVKEEYMLHTLQGRLQDYH